MNPSANKFVCALLKCNMTIPTMDIDPATITQTLKTNVIPLRDVGRRIKKRSILKKHTKSQIFNTYIKLVYIFFKYISNFSVD